jgi:hypothetical protein
MPQATDRHTTSTPRIVRQFSHAELVAGLTAPVLAATAPADAELIALCDRLVAVEGEFSTLMAATGNTIEDEHRTQSQLDAMLADRNRVFDQIYNQPGVTTVAGALAMARAALAVAPRNIAGEIIWTGNGEYLAWSVTEFIIGRGGPVA